MTKERKELEYPDAPSGYVMLYNYKEPFMPFVGGHGYQGVLLFDGSNDTVQCHLCGEWQTYLPGHLKREHTMTAAEYKETVGLEKTSVLISESARAKLIAVNMGKRMKNLRRPKHRSKETREKIRLSLLEHRRETQNKRGTCPLQLIERLQKEFDKRGRTPKMREVKGLYQTITKVYGSWKHACEIAGIPYRSVGTTLRPRAIKQRKRVSYPFSYDRDALLDALRVFKKVNGRDASFSDCRRGLVPTYRRYRHAFGSWKNALAKANI